MTTTAYKYVIENSHTLISLATGEPKVKVVTGEIVEFEDGLYYQGRLHMAGFRKVLENGEYDKLKTNEAVAEENAKKAEEDAVETKKVEAEEAKKLEEEAEGEKVPEVTIPTDTPAPTVETEVKDDGQDAVTVKVKKAK